MSSTLYVYENDWSKTKILRGKSIRIPSSETDLPLGIVINNSERVEMIAYKIIQVPVRYV